MKGPTKKNPKRHYILAFKDTQTSSNFDSIIAMRNFCREQKINYVYDKHKTALGQEWYYYNQI